MYFLFLTCFVFLVLSFLCKVKTPPGLNQAGYFTTVIQRITKEVENSLFSSVAWPFMPLKDEEDQDQGPQHCTKMFSLASALSPFLQAPTAVFPVSCVTNNTQGSSNAPTFQSWIKMNSSSHLCIIHYHYSFYPVSWQCV